MKKALTIIHLFVLQFSIFGQSGIETAVKKHSCKCADEKAVREYFEDLERQRNFIAQCEFDVSEKRKSLNLPLPKKISGFGPSPVSLVKPYYPEVAKNLKIFGFVLVEVFTDEKGLVIYSKVLSGNAFLRESVGKAVCRSRFAPILYCGKPIKARWLIRYHFVPA